MKNYQKNDTYKFTKLTFHLDSYSYIAHAQKDKCLYSLVKTILPTVVQVPAQATCRSNH